MKKFNTFIEKEVLVEKVDVHKELVTVRKNMDAAISAILKKKLDTKGMSFDQERRLVAEYKADAERLSDAARVFAREMRDFWTDWGPEFD